MKSKVKLKAGSGSAQSGQQRLAKSQATKSGKAKERKSVEMKNTLEMTRYGGQVPSAAQGANAQELFGPQEWDALLNSLDNDAQTAAPSARAEGEIELSSDDLWERLSSTRWLREPAADIDRASTITHRPSS